MKFEEGPEHPLGTSGRPLLVQATVLSLGTVSGNVIPLKMTIQKMLKGKILQLSLNKFFF